MQDPGLVGAKEALTLVRCRSCGLTYTDPIDGPRARERYLHQYDLAAHFEPLSKRKEILFSRTLSDLPLPRPGHDRLCDVGCADGQFLRLAGDAGWDADGIELNPPAAASARRTGARVFEGVFEEIEDLDWGTYDVVTCWDVLEHTADPRRFVAKLGRLMVPGGTLALTTLNRRAVASRVFRVNWTMVVEDHFTYWDRHSLTGLLVRSGLSPQAISSYGVGRDFFTWLDRLSSAVTSRLPRRHPPPDRRESGTGTAPRGTWDTWPAVLALERLMNRGLSLVDGGVDLYVIARSG
jgi:SAM-dependent methyltransferase